MAYVKTIWKDQDVENPRTYTMTTNPDTTVTLTDSFGLVTEIGTPVNATNMNHIEDGIGDCDTAITNLQSQVTTLDGSVVKKTGDQTISGAKNFTTSISVPNSSATGSALALSGRGGNWIKVGDGTLLQWGSGATNNHYVDIEMPQSYSTSDSYVVMFGDTGSNTNATAFKVINFISAKKFRVYSGSAGSSDSFKWFAIGK